MKGSEAVNDIGMDRMSPGERGIIFSVSHNGEIYRRMRELGFSVGSELECVGRAPFGEPCAYRVKGAVFALRKRDAKAVRVTLTD